MWDMGFEHAIILEDDLEISSDFFSYFENTAPLLEKDPTIWTVSAFNDNGQRTFASDPEALWRSDFFPGLGKSHATWGGGDGLVTCCGRSLFYRNCVRASPTDTHSHDFFCCRLADDTQAVG